MSRPFASTLSLLALSTLAVLIASSSPAEAKRKKIAYEHKRRSIFERYIPEVARALNSLSGTPIQPTITSLNKIGSAYTAKADTMSEEVEKVSKGGRSRSLTRAAKPKGKKSTAANATATKKKHAKKAKRT